MAATFFSKQDFYMTLPSDASMDIYPNNTVNAYEIKLPYPLHLDRQQWEVGVSEVHFPMTWYNVAPPFDWFALNLKLKKDTLVYESAGSAIPQPQYGVVHYESKKIPIDKGVYSSEDLVKTLNRLIQEHITDVLKEQPSDSVQSDGRRFVIDVKYPADSLRFDMLEDGKVRFQAPQEVAINHPLMGNTGGPLYSTEVIMPSPLSRMLGFVQLPLLGEEDYKTYTETAVPLTALAHWQVGATPMTGGYVEITGDTKAHRLSGFDTVYIYTNLVEDQIVGNTMAPLLIYVPVSKKMMQDSVVIKSPQHIHYLGLRHGSFDGIKLYIMDDTGRPVPFQMGKAIVTLHFRRRY